MDIDQLFNQLKKQHTDNAKQVELTQVEKIIMQLQNTILANEEQLAKTSNEVELANSRISELTSSLNEVDAKNVDISEDMTTLEERLVSLERENWKFKRNSDGNNQRVEVLKEENKVLSSTFTTQEVENAKLRKELSEFNKDLQCVCNFIDKFLESDKKLCKTIGRVQEKQKEVKKLQNSMISEEKYEKYFEAVSKLTEYYDRKLQNIENDKKIVVTEMETLKVDYEILKNSIEENSSETSDILLRMVAKQCRTSNEFFRKNQEDQEGRIKRLTELLERETATGTKLKMLLERRKNENKELQNAVEGDVKVKDETILLGD